MTAQELIELLEEMPPEAVVYYGLIQYRSSMRYEIHSVVHATDDERRRGVYLVGDEPSDPDSPYLPREVEDKV